MTRSRSSCLALLISLLAAGCAISPSTPDDVMRASATAEDSATLHTELIRTLIAQQQYYAALAHVEDAQQREAEW